MRESSNLLLLSGFQILTEHRDAMQEPAWNSKTVQKNTSLQIRRLLQMLYIRSSTYSV